MTYDELKSTLIAMGWEDSSYGNDACPSMGYQFNAEECEYLYRLWTDDPDYDMRETPGPRYTLMRGDDVICSSESAQAVYQAIEALPEFHTM